MWPTQAGSGGGYYYPGWPAQTGYNANAAAQQADPSDWAAKAAQWAQHKQAESQYLQQMSNWQHAQHQQYNQMQPMQQQVQSHYSLQQQVHQQAPVHQSQQQYGGVVSATNPGGEGRQPQVYSQPSSSQSIAPPAPIQPVKPSGYQQQTQSPLQLVAEKTQPKPLFPPVQSQQQQQGNQFQPPTSALTQSPATSAVPATGPGSLSEPPQSTNTIHPLFDSAQLKFSPRNFQSHGFQETPPPRRGIHRGGGPRPHPPRPQGRGPSPKVWKKWNEQSRDGFHSGPRPPTEEVFGDEQGIHGCEREDHSRWSEMDHSVQDSGHQLEGRYPGDNSDRFGHREPLPRLQDNWSTFRRDEHSTNWERQRETDQKLDHMDRPPHGPSPYDQQAQYEKEERDLYQSDQDSHTSSHERNQIDSFNVDPTNLDYGSDTLSGQKGSPSLSTVSSHKSDEPTISSLRKGTSAVIPGLGEFDSKGDNTSESAGQELSLVDHQEKPGGDKSLGDAQVNIGGGQANEMIESLGKIVSQLQTLKGLTSSLQLLKALPKASQEELLEDEMRMKEKDISEEAKRKVAALLANESDSDGEQGPPRQATLDDSGDIPRRMTDSYADSQHRDLPGSTKGGPSPPAREFDGTYNVKPQVYSTYSNEDDRRQGGDHCDDYRDNPQYSNYPQSRSEADYPPRSAHQSQPPTQDYSYPSSLQGDRERRFGGPDSRYDPEMEREYDRQRMPAQYDQRGYERGYEHESGQHPLPPPPARDYPPEHFRRPLGEYDQPQPSPVGGRGREGGQYYDQPPEPVIPRERPPVLPDPDYTHGNIASKMQTIDYSHGSGMHTVDYNHGAASAATTSPAPPFRDRPKMGADYPREFPSYGGPGQFPTYASQYPATAFPPGPEMYGGMAGSYLPPGLDPATLFLAYSQAGESKRKALPLWLREELEKMERKKQKQMAKEAEEAMRRGEERGDRPKWRDELNSDEEDEEGRRNKIKRERTESPVSEKKSWSHRSYRHSSSKSPARSESGSPTPQRKRRREELPVEDEEDKQISMIMKVRKTLTEILLDVTDQEIESTAKEAVEEAKQPKMAFTMKQQMTTPSKENVLAGLSMYASESESEEEPDRQKRSTSRSKSRFSKEPTTPTAKGEFKSPKEPKAHHRKESNKPHSTSKSRNEDDPSSGSSSKNNSLSSKSKHNSNSGSSSSSDKEKKEKKKEKSSSSHKDSKGGSSSNSTKKKNSSSDSDSRDKERGKETPSTSKRHSSSSKSERARSHSPSPPPRRSSSSKHKSSSSSSRARSRSRSTSPPKSSKSSSSKSTSGSKGTPSSSSSSRKRSDSFTTSSRSKTNQRSPSPVSSSAYKHSRHRSRSRSRSPSRKKSSQRRSSSTKKSPPPRSKPVSTYRVVQIKE